MAMKTAAQILKELESVFGKSSSSPDDLVLRCEFFAGAAAASFIFHQEILKYEDPSVIVRLVGEIALEESHEAKSKIKF